MQIEYRGERQPRLIEDIVIRPTKHGFDPRNEVVRHQAIGAMDQQYLHLRATRTSPATPKFSYTRIPPLASLATLDFSGPQFNEAAARSRTMLVAAAAGIVDRLSALGTRINSIVWLPWRYRAGSGLYIAWGRKTMLAVKRIAPALLGLVCLILLALVSPPSHFFTLHPKTSRPDTSASGVTGITARTAASRTTLPQTSDTSGQPAGTAATALQPIPSQAVSGAPASAPATTPTIPTVTSALPAGGNTISTGGLTSQLPSGSPVTTPTTPTPATQPLPTTTTVTVPPETIQVGNKPLLSTDGTSLLLN